MMPLAVCALTLLGLVPLARAWRANRTTSLAHAVGWAAVAWVGWGLALGLGRPDRPGFVAERYIALCLTGAAGVAVLGARRPYVGAWNFVVLGLLGVLLLPLAESAAIGTDPADPLRTFFLAATLAVGILNYLPTRGALAALVLGLGCAGELLALYVSGVADEALGVSHGLILLAPWVGWGCWWRRRAAGSTFDGLWLGFRDRFGALWGQRVRDHFNAAAKNAGWPVVLTWGGLRGTAAPEMEATLRAVVKRFL